MLGWIILNEMKTRIISGKHHIDLDTEDYSILIIKK